MQELAQAVRDRTAVLFVGAGLSMNLGLPSFTELISRLAEELDFDPAVFSLSGDFLSLAEYYYLQKGSLGPLRSWMDRTWHDSRIRIDQSEVHKTIVALRFPIIYTTNYDRWIEKAFDEAGKCYTKIANVADIARVADNRTQIIKFHGDFDDDASIVLTESSYFERLTFESPLDIKLRSDVLGRTILFVGYSLTDINIRYLLYKLYKQWQASPYEHARPRSYVFLARPNVVQEEVLRSRGIEPLVSEDDDPRQGLERFLKRLLAEGFGQNSTVPKQEATSLCAAPDGRSKHGIHQRSPVSAGVSPREAGMQPRFDKLERILRAELDALAERGPRRRWSDKQWTRQIKIALSRLGARRNYRTYTSGRRLGAAAGEWVYDVTWTNEDKGYVLTVPLVAESEWAITGASDDFQKLLIARADHRLMIFNPQYRRTPQRSTQELIREVKRYRRRVPGDRFLFACWDESKKGFRYELYVVDAAG